MSEDIVTRLDQLWGSLLLEERGESAETCAIAIATIAALRADKDRLEMDAARYRWLRSFESNSLVYVFDGSDESFEFGNDKYGEWLDSAIDAAIKEQP